jgi:hypothetical protein
MQALFYPRMSRLLTMGACLFYLLDLGGPVAGGLERGLLSIIS